MFSDLPKLLDRNFAIGFFLPGTLLTLGCFFVLALHGEVDLPDTLDDLGRLSSAVLAIVVVWLVAISLLALNYPILRFMEGYPIMRLIDLYGRYHPSGKERLNRLIQRRFERRIRPAFELQARIDRARANGLLEPAMHADHPRHLARAAECYPDEAQHVLPTRLGNLFRAFEVYPRVLYGLDAIPAWPRLQAVMPDHCRKALADAKAQLDFCVNLTFSAASMTMLHLGLGLWRFDLPAPWLGPIGLGLAAVGYWLSLSAASQFGGYVKTAFDLYRGDLAKALGLKVPDSMEAERVMWRAVSRMIIYRSAARGAELTRFRARHEEDRPSVEKREADSAEAWDDSS